MLKLEEKNIKIVVTTVSFMIKNLSTDLENSTKMPIKFLDLKDILSEMYLRKHIGYD